MEVEKDVPVSEVANRKYPLADMDVGDSFFMATEAIRAIGQRIRSSVQHYRRTNPHTKFVVRAVDGGIRCWRVK